jgi:hypothetical protein
VVVGLLKEKAIVNGLLLFHYFHVIVKGKWKEERRDGGELDSKVEK